MNSETGLRHAQLPALTAALALFGAVTSLACGPPDCEPEKVTTATPIGDWDSIADGLADRWNRSARVYWNDDTDSTFQSTWDGADAQVTLAEFGKSGCMVQSALVQGQLAIASGDARLNEVTQTEIAIESDPELPSVGAPGIDAASFAGDLEFDKTAAYSGVVMELAADSDGLTGTVSVFSGTGPDDFELVNVGVIGPG